MVTLVGLFLITHGLVHLAIFAPRPGPSVPWVPARPFIPGMAAAPAGGRRLAALAFAGGTGLLFLVAGMAAITGRSWWVPTALLAVGASAVLLAGNFHALLASGLLLDVAILGAVAATA
jgi:hypothetical protein